MRLLRVCFFVSLLQITPVIFVFSQTLVVTNRADDTVSLIDLESRKALATLPTGNEPNEVAVTEDGRLAVVTNYGEREKPGNSLTVINIPKALVIRTVDLGKYEMPHGIQWLYENKFIVTVESNEAVIVVDVESGKVEKEIETDEKISHMIVVTKDRQRAFVANVGSGSVTVLDLNEWKRVKEIKTGAGAEGIMIMPDGKEVWVANRGADMISVIDTDTLKVKETTVSPTFPIRVVPTPNGDYALACNAQSADIQVFDPRFKRPYGRIRIPLENVPEGNAGTQGQKNSAPISILISPDSKQAYVAHSNTNALSVIDLMTWKVVGNLNAGRGPDGMGYSALDVNR